MQRFATHGTANKPHRTTTHTWFGDSLPQANMLNTCAMPCGHLQHTSQRSLRRGGDRRDRRRWIHYEDVVGGRWRKRATPGNIGVPTTYRCGKPTQPSMEVQSNGPRNNRTRASSKNNLNTRVLANHGRGAAHPFGRVHSPRLPRTPMSSHDTRHSFSHQA